jgi:ribonuclease BN (tRNA processing enzyme)
MAFDLHVLGSAGSHAGRDRVCSGYLLESGGTRLLVDCGNGASATLQRFCDFDDLDGIVITHRHVDHCIDLIGMFYALRFHEDGHQTVRLYAAPEVHDMLTGLLSDDSAFAFNEVFHHVPIRAGDHFRVGDFDITCYPSVHPVPTVSLRIAAGGRCLTYSSDSAGGPDLVAAAEGCDLFLCEATWQGDGSDLPPDIHLTATEAGEFARMVGVPRLMITHVLGSLDPGRSVEEASKAFGGDVELAVQGESVAV